MVTPKAVDKEFDKVQQPIKIKTSDTLGIERRYLNLMNSIYFFLKKNITNNIIFKCERLKNFSNIRNKT